MRALIGGMLISTLVSHALLDLLAKSPFKRKDILTVDRIRRDDLHHLFSVAHHMRLGMQSQTVSDILKGRVLATIFYETSTRTSASFDAAMQLLGGRTVPVTATYSSTQKGETLQDMLRTLGSYSDAIVLRHPEASSMEVAAKYSPVPVINGGNGSLEHPTQAFLDLFTIREEISTVNDKIVTFVGDLRYGRTVHSLAKLLALYENVKIQLVSPPSLAIPTEVRQQIVRSGQLLLESTELSPKIIAESDVLYCTRVQKERFDDPEEYESMKGSYGIDSAMMRHAKAKMTVMHPLPRNEELAEEIDDDPRAAYFRQVGG